MSEADAIRARYARRPRGANTRGDELMREERNRAVLQLLRRTGMDPATARVLDIGCGTGEVLGWLLEIGFAARCLTGIDLISERAATARRTLLAEVTVLQGDATAAEALPGSDLVLLFTVFSSILEPAYRKVLARKAWEAVAPGGSVLCYDFLINNPQNPDVRSLSIRELKQLFPEAMLTYERITLAPPVARALPGLYAALNALPFLRTHALCWLKKN